MTALKKPIPAEGAASIRKVRWTGMRCRVTVEAGQGSTIDIRTKPADLSTSVVAEPRAVEAGELVAYAGRAIDDSEPKYKLPTGFKKSQVLYNLARAREDNSTGMVVLVEGFFDCIDLPA